MRLLEFGLRNLDCGIWILDKKSRFQNHKSKIIKSSAAKPFTKQTAAALPRPSFFHPKYADTSPWYVCGYAQAAPAPSSGQPPYPGAS